MLTLLLAAQDNGPDLASWQVAALFVAMPAAAVAIIAAVVLKLSAPATKGAFPVLQPGRPPDHEEPAVPQGDVRET